MGPQSGWGLQDHWKTNYNSHDKEQVYKLFGAVTDLAQMVLDPNPKSS